MMGYVFIISFSIPLYVCLNYLKEKLVFVFASEWSLELDIDLKLFFSYNKFETGVIYRARQITNI